MGQGMGFWGHGRTWHREDPAAPGLNGGFEWVIAVGIHRKLSLPFKQFVPPECIFEAYFGFNKAVFKAH